MEKLASRHAITELMSWISLMENIIEEDLDKIMGAVGSEMVQNFLQKYKVQNCFFLSTPKLSAIPMFSFSLLYHSLIMCHLYFPGLPHRSDL